MERIPQKICSGIEPGLRFITCCLFGILLSATIFHLQSFRDSKSSHFESTEEFNYLPNGTFLRGAALSFDDILADLLWIKTISYFGDHLDRDQNYQWLNHLLEVITTLDPYFHDPYEFGGIILSWELHDADSGTKILLQGMENVPKQHPRYWYLPFFTGFNYMYYKHDYQKAAEYLEIAASFPQSPKYLPLLVSRLYANTSDPGMAIPFLEEMLAQADSPKLQESLQRRINEIHVKQHINVLTAASKHFQEQTGNALKNIDDLVSNGVLKTLPIEPFGGKYLVRDDGVIESSSKIDSMELHIDKQKDKKNEPLIFLQEPK